MVGRMAPATRILLASYCRSSASYRFLAPAFRQPTLEHRAFQHHRAPDYYAILGVVKHAEIKDIKFAYFNMARKFHPDTNKTLDAKQMFSLIAEAYDVLSDAQRRAKYDETGFSEDRFGGQSTGPGRQSTDSAYTAEQMYETIFGAGAKEAEGGGRVHEDFAESQSGQEVSREYIVQVRDQQKRGVKNNFLMKVQIFLCPGLCRGSCPRSAGGSAATAGRGLRQVPGIQERARVHRQDLSVLRGRSD